MKDWLILLALYLISVIIARHAIKIDLEKEGVKPDIVYVLFTLVPLGNLSIAVLLICLHTFGKSKYFKNFPNKFFGIDKEKGDK